MNDDPIQHSDVFPKPEGVEMSMPSEKSIHLAAQCWCDKETGMIKMDTRLANAFAKRLDVLFQQLEIAKAPLKSFVLHYGDYESLRKLESLVNEAREALEKLK